jgi:hypothetical protein
MARLGATTGWELKREVLEMVRVLLGGFVVAHGLVTAVIWATPSKGDAPFRATHSWLLGDVRSLAVALAGVAALGFVLAGVGFLAHQSWWAVLGIAAGAVALVLMGLYFNPWLLAGIAISGGVLYAGVQALQQA